MALSENTDLRLAGGRMQRMPLLAGVTPFAGSLLGNSGGFVRPLIAGDAFVGVSRERVATAATVSGATALPVIIDGYGEVPLTGVVDANIRAAVYASDDGTYTLTAAGNSYLGTIAGVPRANVALLRFSAGKGSMVHQVAGDVAITGGAIEGITDLAVADGGTGASDAAGARTNLGLDTMATQAADNVAITGGAVEADTTGSTFVTPAALDLPGELHDRIGEDVVGALTLDAEDCGKLLNVTGAHTLTLPAAAAGVEFAIRAAAVATITLVPDTGQFIRQQAVATVATNVAIADTVTEIGDYVILRPTAGGHIIHAQRGAWAHV